MRRLYRSRAIASAQVGDRMDMPVRIVRIRAWVALAIGALCAIAIGAWLLVGTVRTTASGPAVFTRGLFSVPIQASTSITIIKLKVRDGDRVRMGQELFTGVTADGRVLVLRAPIDGTAASVRGTEPGAIFEGLDVLMVIQRDAPVVVQALIPVSQADAIRPGMSASIVPDSAPAGAYGVIPGVVLSRTDLPVDPTFMKRIATATGNVLGASMEPAVLVTIDPQAADTPSGFAWTAGSGPERTLQGGTAATATVTIRSTTPIKVILGTDR
ncbi:MAG: hypothetical protein RLZZ163_1344 [Actinomycetota bacterium]|jgi:multidrug resistance efflux pump